MPKPEIFVPQSHSKFDAGGKLTDEATRQALAKWLAAFADWVEKRP